MWLVHDLSIGDPLASTAATSGASTMELGLSSMFKGNAVIAFSLALAVFAVFALGSILATASLCAGQRALRLGSATAPLLAGVLSAGLYLTTMLGLLVGAAVA